MKKLKIGKYLIVWRIANNGYWESWESKTTHRRFLLLISKIKNYDKDPTDIIDAREIIIGKRHIMITKIA